MSATSVETGYAPVNDLQMYYEIHGSGGVPVVLLQGSYMSTGAMEFLLSGLANTRQVIATDFQGHGRTADVDRPLTYEQMADDVAGLMEHLGIAQADIVGYSMGGAYRTPARHCRPELVRKLVAISAQFASTASIPRSSQASPNSRLRS